MARAKDLLGFHSDLNIQECVRRLHEAIDPEKRTLFSLSGYKGSKPIIGRVNGHEFFIHKRRYYRNDFALAFYAAFSEPNRGTLIEGHFDTPRWTRIFMRIWLAGVILLGIPIFVPSLLEIFRGAGRMQGDPWVGLVVPPALVLSSVLLPKFGWWLSKGEQRFVLDFLQTTLVARPIHEFERNTTKQ